jgi:hypothetical protein
LQRCRKLVPQFLKLGRLDDEGGREQQMVALHAVDGASHRIAQQSLVQRFLLDAGMDPQGRVEGLFQVALAHEFRRPEQAPAAGSERIFVPQAAVKDVAHAADTSAGIARMAQHAAPIAREHAAYDRPK